MISTVFIDVQICTNVHTYRRMSKPNNNRSRGKHRIKLCELCFALLCIWPTNEHTKRKRKNATNERKKSTRARFHSFALLYRDTGLIAIVVVLLLYDVVVAMSTLAQFVCSEYYSVCQCVVAMKYANLRYISWQPRLFNCTSAKFEIFETIRDRLCRSRSNNWRELHSVGLTFRMKHWTK